MNVSQQLLFLISALGAVNGFALSGYFLFKRSEQRLSDLFLGGLLLMLSIRVIKSAFLFFNGQLFEAFIQVGIGACALIGPLLYLYVRSMDSTAKAGGLRKWWWLHVLPYLLMVGAFSLRYGYYEHRVYWGWFIELVYKQWGIYVLLSGYLLRTSIRNIFQRPSQLRDQEAWMLNIFLGTAIVWLAYETSYYTSYIVGAVSFTFILYLSVLLWGFKWAKKELATDPPLKYANSSLSDQDVRTYWQQLRQYIEAEQPYLDPELSLAKLSEQLGRSSKELSQVINQTTGQNYSRYIASLRVEAAKAMLRQPDYEAYTIAAIAYESGFSSLSSFNAYFKKLVGTTAKAYREKR